MTTITLALGSLGLFIVLAFVASYTVWHRRVASCFERVPVGGGRTALCVRRGVNLDAVLDGAAR